MRCNMTVISLESFRNSGLAALRIPSEPRQEPSSQDFKAVIHDISSQLDQAGLKGQAQQEFVDLPNMGLPILPQTNEEERVEDNQEDTASVSTQVHLLPDILIMVQPSVDIPTYILPFADLPQPCTESTLDLDRGNEALEGGKVSEVMLSVPLKLPESPQRAIHQEATLSKGNDVGDLIKTLEPLSSECLSIDLSLKPSKNLNIARPRNVQLAETLRLEQDNVALKMEVGSLNERVSSIASPSEEMKHRMNVEPHDEMEYTAEWSVNVSSLPLTQLKAKATKDNSNEGDASAGVDTSVPTAPDAAKDVLGVEPENPYQQKPLDFVMKEYLVDAESNKIPLVYIPEQLSVVKEASENNADLEPEVWIKTVTSTTTIEAPVSDTAVQVQGQDSGKVLETDPKQQIARSVLEVKDTLLPKEIKTLSISLNPETLGQVNVELVLDEAGKIHVNLAVLKAETFETLQQDFSQLKTILNEIGIEDGNVSLQLASDGEDHRHQKEEYVSWEDRESMLVRQPNLASIPVEKIQTYPERKSLKRLDIRA